MKFAIHHRKNSFSDRWSDYCVKHSIDYITVDCYSSDIIQELISANVTHLMWHLNHSSRTDIEYGILIMNAVDAAGIKTYPNYETRWHFDNKVAQKYLLESIDAPLVKSYVFYDKKHAIEFIKKATFPKVAKLKRGAGATNVELINNYEEGISYINKLFGSGILSTSKAFDNFEQKFRTAKQIKNPISLFTKLVRFIRKNNKEREFSNPEKGYVYFQDFLQHNNFDTRIIVVGNKAFGLRRFNRKNDFRASGSGLIDYNISEINLELIEIAFKISGQLEAQCLAFDFVYDGNKPNVIEICFGFAINAYNDCEGYWNDDLTFIKSKFNPQYFMIEDFIYTSHE